MSDLFVTRGNKYDLRNSQTLEFSHKRTIKFGTETISCRGPQIWHLIPERLRTLATLNKCKKNGSLMPAHVECAKHIFRVLALLTKNCNVLFLGHSYSNSTCFLLFINRNISLKIHTTDIISL